MIKPSRILVGEVLEIDKSDYLIVRYKRTNIIKLINLQEWVFIDMNYSNLKERNPIRKGYLGPKVTGTDDFICHYCYPSQIDGCKDCLYQGLVKKRKHYFDPGTVVFDPVFKKKYTVAETILGFFYEESRGKFITIPLIDYLNAKVFRESILKLGINNINFVHLFKLSGDITRKTYFNYIDINLFKRYKYLPDLKQLDYVCNDLCIYGRDSWKCKECETNLIRNDLQGDCI